LSQDLMTIAAVHAGAGYHSKDNAPEYKKLLTKALKTALSASNPTEGMQHSIIILENHHLTSNWINFIVDAGISGSNMCLDGTIECDASIMSTKGMGSVLAVPMLVDNAHPNPISIAAKVLELALEGVDGVNRQPPIAIAGFKAQDFASQAGLHMISKDRAKSLILPYQVERYHRHLNILKNHLQSQNEFIDQDLLQDTVGGIMIDSNDVCAAVSSGGISLKRPGRVGEAGLPGTGLWAAEKDDLKVGISISGTGEQIMKSFLALRIVDRIFSSPDTIQTVLKDCMNEFLNNPMIAGDPEKNAGALILVSNGPHAECWWAHTTETFCIAYQSENEQKPTFCISMKHQDKDFCVAGGAF
jgi:taspase, threonine aspartase, 1